MCYPPTQPGVVVGWPDQEALLTITNRWWILFLLHPDQQDLNLLLNYMWKNSSSVSFLTKCPCAVVNLLAGLHGTIYGFIDEKKTSGPLGGSWLRNMSPPSTGNNVKLML